MSILNMKKGLQKRCAKMKERKSFSIYNMVLMALFASVICIVGPLAVPVGPVPISLMNLVLFMSVYVLGWKKGTIAYLVYLCIGLIGLPVFSGFEGGIGKLMGPTGGYLVGFIFTTIVSGIIIEKWGCKKFVVGVGMGLGMLIAYGFGTAWFCASTGNGIVQALWLCVLPFVLGDIVKIIVAISIGNMLRCKIESRH